MGRIDHLMWGAARLAEAVTELTDRFGAAPIAGGSHPGNGTRNALLGLGEGCYLEIIVPDPAQDPREGFGAALAALDTAGLVTFAVASRDLPGEARRLAAAGCAFRGPLDMRRTTPEGEELRWQLLLPRGHDFGGVLPFFIDWGDTPHPARRLPAGGELRALTLRSPAAAALRGLLANVDGPIEVVEDQTPALEADLLTPAGHVRLTSTARTVVLGFG